MRESEAGRPAGCEGERVRERQVRGVISVLLHLTLLGGKDI